MATSKGAPSGSNATLKVRSIASGPRNWLAMLRSRCSAPCAIRPRNGVPSRAAGSPGRNSPMFRETREISQSLETAIRKPNDWIVPGIWIGSRSQLVRSTAWASPLTLRPSAFHSVENGRHTRHARPPTQAGAHEASLSRRMPVASNRRCRMTRRIDGTWRGLSREKDHGLNVGPAARVMAGEKSCPNTQFTQDCRSKFQLRCCQASKIGIGIVRRIYNGFISDQNVFSGNALARPIMSLSIQ